MRKLLLRKWNNIVNNLVIFAFLIKAKTSVCLENKENSLFVYLRELQSTKLWAQLKLYKRRRRRKANMSSIGTGYDLSVTTFSPDGRVFQIEYAGKAVDNSGTVVGIKCKDGIVLVWSYYLFCRLEFICFFFLY